ncbi:hypothetical protein GKZ68_21010 (plasmid) [Hymenobacter sp. BRD128]|uniref:hypothetical protein n=1 Tax=Hymenobacter sp. BRD128 TaxID=2675878 RepID=UPI00156375F0|nr:hypothetical protein [Hymenobacter sp. BRD128]QKG59163.1 hypothetical protein GKZ68_21010 [Hymenobacter sp. BRD128]
MPTPSAKAARAEPPVLPSLNELVDAQKLTHTGINSQLHLNQRTLKHRLEAPWLFNVVELTKLARLLQLQPGDLFSLVRALAERNGEFNPDRAPIARRAGRPRRPSPPCLRPTTSWPG